MKKSTKKALDHFKKHDKVLFNAAKTFDFDEDLTPDQPQNYFYSLCRSVVGQQLADAAASTILSRFVMLFPGKIVTPKKVLKIPCAIGNQNLFITQTFTPTNSVTPSYSATVTKTPTPIPPTATRISTTAVPENNILISYYINGNDSMPFFPACLGGINLYRFILFDDGQLILYINDQYMETMLSKEQINNLLDKIALTGYFEIDNPENIYTVTPPEPSFPYTSWEEINVTDHRFIIYAWEYKYITSAIKDVIMIIRNYQPVNLHDYLPKQVYLFAVPYLGLNSDMEFGAPDMAQLDWPEDVIPLKNYSWPYSKLPESDSAYILQQFGKVPVNRLVEQDGQVYQVMVCPILPDS